MVGLVPWHRQRPDRLLLLGMIATALALTAAVELIVLKGDVGRMNTVFKFYLQVWVLLGLAAAIAAVRLLQRWRPGRRLAMVVSGRGGAAGGLPDLPGAGHAREAGAALRTPCRRQPTTAWPT